MSDSVSTTGYVPGRHIPGDESARADVGTSPDLYTADEDGSPADKCTVLYGRRWFFGLWVVPPKRWIELAMDEIARDSAASTDAGRVADVAPDH
jgi:hypothetical protein